MHAQPHPSQNGHAAPPGAESDAEDDALVEAVARGERAALARLYARHGERVHRIAWRFLHDAEEAQDVTQAVFLGLIEGASTYRRGNRFTTWLFRIVANRCLNQRARADHRLRARRVDDEALAALPDEAGRGPGGEAERRDLGRRLQSALAALPPRQRLAVVLADVEGQSQREIAAALDISVGAVESLLIRGREGLRATLRAGDCPECPPLPEV